MSDTEKNQLEFDDSLVRASNLYQTAVQEISQLRKRLGEVLYERNVATEKLGVEELFKQNAKIQIAEAEDNIRRYRLQHDEDRMRIAALEESLKKAEAQLVKKEPILVQAVPKLFEIWRPSIRSHLEEMEERIKVLEADKAQAYAEYAKLRDKYAEKIAKEDHIEAVDSKWIADLNTRIKVLEADKAKAYTDYAALKARYDLNLLAPDHAALVERYMVMHMKLVECKQTLKDKEQQVDNLLKLNANQDIEIRRLQDQLKAEQVPKDERMRVLQQRIDDQKQIIDMMHSDISGYNERLTEQKQAYSQLHKDYNELKNSHRYEYLRNEIARQIQVMRDIADATERNHRTSPGETPLAFYRGRIACLREQAMNLEDILSNFPKLAT